MVENALFIAMAWTYTFHIVTVLSTIFGKSFYCPALYKKIENLQNFAMIECKTFCRNYLCMKSCILFIGFIKKNRISSVFPIVIMAAKYADIDSVGKFEAGFQQVPLVQTL